MHWTFLSPPKDKFYLRVHKGPILISTRVKSFICGEKKIKNNTKKQKNIAVGIALLLLLLAELDKI